MPNLDSDLLRNQGEESETASELRQRKKEASGDEGGDEAGQAGEEPKSLRERVRRAREAMNLKERAKKKLQEKVATPIKTGISKLLCGAWRITFSVIGFLPGLLYVNIHVFLRTVVSNKLFCKLGEEWIPRNIVKSSGGSGKTAVKMIGFGEVMLLTLLDLATIIIITLIIAAFMMLIDLATGWFGWVARLVS